MNGHGAKADMEDAEGESTSKTARSDTDDPFYLPHCESDVTLVVEDKKLHVHKAVLSLHSPVFGAMFTANFAEKDSKEIELPGKKYDLVMQFLLMMYPVHSVKAIRDDDVLVNILPLAEEYQSEHIRVKCEAYIGHQLQYHGGRVSSDRKLLYLLICEQYRLKEHWETLLKLCSNLGLPVIEKNKYFNKLTPTAQSEVLKRRCRVVEDLLERQQKAARMLGTEPKVCFPQRNVCGECGADLTHKTKICKTCIQQVFTYSV